MAKNEDHGIWSHHFLANRWGESRNSDVLFSWAPKSLEDGDCSLEMKKRLLLRRKGMTNLESILKIIPLTKVHTVKAMVFPLVMGGCDSDHKEG